MNLTLAWLLTVVSAEDWDTDFKPVLSKGFDDFANERETRQNWGDPDAEGKGEFKLIREDLKGPRAINLDKSEKPVPK